MTRRVAALAIFLTALATPLAGWSRGEGRWARLSEATRQTVQLRRAVGAMQRSGQVRTAHPEAARRLSAELSKKMGRQVRVPAGRIIQVEYGSPAHQQLKQHLQSSIGVGIYPSARWGHTKLRVGRKVTDAVPRGARPFPSTGTRARVVELDKMHRRFYEAVFPGEPAAVQRAATRAQSLASERCSAGMGCASYVSKIVREHIKEHRASTGQTPYNGKLSSLMRSEASAGTLWRKAASSNPALIVVYTPPGDFRNVASPDFRFDYVLPSK